MVKVCQCCGHPLPTIAVESTLTPLQARLYRAVKRAGRAGIDAQTLMDRVYADDPNGGPESRNILHVARKQMAPRLASHGLTIASSRGPGALWTLEKIDV